VYLIGRDGLVFDKSFVANHQVRESMNDVLQESFRVTDLERGEVDVQSSPHLAARAYLASPTIRREQLIVLTVEVSLADGMHMYGRPLPEGYIPVELTLDNSEALYLDRVDYPEPEEMYLEILDERLPVYTGQLEIKAHCRGGNIREDSVFQVAARLRYQACDDHKCYLPQALVFSLSLHGLPHDWEKFE
jgi:hypothetical protein